MAEYQCTVEKETSVSGVGIHTGNKASVRFLPAEEGSGIIFVRVDLPEAPSVPANIDYVTEVARGTTLENGAAKVHTVEHLMATACALGIDNLIVELDSDELPVGDGSSQIYLKALLAAGLKEQKEERVYFTPTKPIVHKYKNTELLATPSEQFKISSTINYEKGFIRSQFLSQTITKENYINNIASARTYCFEEEILALKEMGLGKGGNLENTIVVGETSIQNTELRFEDELVRHKILDLIGDLFLLGFRINADVLALRSGHAANIELARKIKENYLETRAAEDVIIVDSNDILKLLPHRYPFIMVDRIELFLEKKQAIGYKNITLNEPCIKGHFPDNPVFPSTLIIESMAQSSAVMFLSQPELKNKLAFFIIIDKAEFYAEVKPYDVLVSKVELIRARTTGGKVRGISYVGDKKIAEVEFMFALVDKE